MVKKQPLLQLELFPQAPAPVPVVGSSCSSYSCTLTHRCVPARPPPLLAPAPSPSAVTFTVSVKTLFADAASSSLWLGFSGCTWSLRAASSTHLPARTRDSAAGRVSSLNASSLDSSANLEQKPLGAQLFAIS